VRSTGVPADFIQIVGITDSGSFSHGGPSWEAPSRYQNQCYLADIANPAADVAAQSAAALAILSHVLTMYGTAADRADGDGGAGRLLRKARHAYTYAMHVTRVFEDDAVCTRSGARSNCVGTCSSGSPRSVRCCWIIRVCCRRLLSFVVVYCSCPKKAVAACVVTQAREPLPRALLLGDSQHHVLFVP
jgi:Glycosyl hydrolase family 9